MVLLSARFKTIDKFQLFWTLVTFGSGVKCYMYYKVEEIF